MAADAWIMYDQAMEYIGDGTIDLDAGDAYFAAVLLASSYTKATSHSTYADISTPELSTANGYTVGGNPLVSVTWVNSSGTITFDCANPVWTASGGSIVARHAAIVHVAAGSGDPQSTDKLICESLLDNTPGDVTVTTGNTLTLTINASGVFTAARA